MFLWNSQLFLDLDQERMAFYNYLNEDIKHVEIFENYFIVPIFTGMPRVYEDLRLIIEGCVIHG